MEMGAREAVGGGVRLVVFYLEKGLKLADVEIKELLLLRVDIVADDEAVGDSHSAFYDQV